MEFNNQAVIVQKCALGFAETLSRKSESTIKAFRSMLIDAAILSYSAGEMNLNDYEITYRLTVLISEIYRLRFGDDVPKELLPLDFQAVKEQAKAGRLK